MTVRPNQILIRGGGETKEGIATESITPGHLLDFQSGSAATPPGTHLTAYLKKHATSGGNAQKMFALEQDYIGSVPPAVAVDKTYANRDAVPYIVASRGTEIFALLAASQNVAYGDYLESNGDGTLKAIGISSAASAQNNRLVARALEASNVGTVARLIVEVL